MHAQTEGIKIPMTYGRNKHNTTKKQNYNTVSLYLNHKNEYQKKVM